MISDLEVILNDRRKLYSGIQKNANKSLASEVCAFANASGGRVFIGGMVCARKTLHHEAIISSSNNAIISLGAKVNMPVSLSEIPLQVLE